MIDGVFVVSRSSCWTNCWVAGEMGRLHLCTHAFVIGDTKRSMGSCKKDVTQLLTHWSYAFLVLIHRDYNHRKFYHNSYFSNKKLILKLLLRYRHHLCVGRATLEYKYHELILISPPFVNQDLVCYQCSVHNVISMTDMLVYSNISMFM